MGFTYFMLSLAATICTSAISVYLCRAFFRPSGWTKKDNYGVAVRFKVFFPLYLQKPEKWKLMPDKAVYDNMMTVYFSSGLEWRKYNRWRKRAEKERMKRQQEERKQRFYEMIFKEYEPEFTTEKCEDCFVVNGGIGNPIVAVIPKPGYKPTNAELDKIRADLELSENIYLPTDPGKLKAEIKRWADSKDWGINPMELAVKAAIEQYKEGKQNQRCKDCYYMIWKPNGDKFETVCCKDLKESGYCDHIHPEMTACNRYKSRSEYGSREVRDYARWAAARDAILHSVKTEEIQTSSHYE